MIQKPGLTIDGRVDAPEDRHCAMGHVVPQDALLNGEPVRFFRVTSGAMDFGLVCDTCLTVAHTMVKNTKHNHIKLS